MDFQLVTTYKPRGDQPRAIAELRPARSSFGIEVLRPGEVLRRFKS